MTWYPHNFEVFDKMIIIKPTLTNYNLPNNYFYFLLTEMGFHSFASILTFTMYGILIHIISYDLVNNFYFVF